MATVTHVHRSENDDLTAVYAVVMLVAVVLLIGFALFALQSYPFVPADTGSTQPGGIELNVNGGFPSPSPSPAPTPSPSY